MGTYADLADEYYDPEKHPTSANFRTASREIIRAWLGHPFNSEVLCDVGAGDSLLADVMTERGLGLSRTVLVDTAPGMLAHSDHWRDLGAKTVVADAEQLPFDDREFGIVVASLGDPFNTPAFWHEGRRVLRHGGRVIYTTPSFEWAESFRSRNQEPPDAAEFILADGSRIHVQSLVLTESDQVVLINESGLRVVGIYHVLLAALGSEPVSSKLNLPAATPFVSGYLAVAD
jgi:ubiquinone/menaquinone biosynthesis C-methylase UbiE